MLLVLLRCCSWFLIRLDGRPPLFAQSSDILLARGAKLSCSRQTVFCDGPDRIDKQPGSNIITNCDSSDFIGTQGQGSCPAN